MRVEARALVRGSFDSSIDIKPDGQANTLSIRIHRMAAPAQDKALGLLLADLTDQAFCHPETGAEMIFRLVWCAIDGSLRIRKSGCPQKKQLSVFKMGHYPSQRCPAMPPQPHRV